MAQISLFPDPSVGHHVMQSIMMLWKVKKRTANLKSKHDLPTPESPISSSCNRSTS